MNTQQQQRDAFEGWFKSKGGKLDIPAAPIPDLIKAIAWEGWQAAQAQQVPTRDDIIQCLLATQNNSEGETADLILGMMWAGKKT